jgi:hypothetical protein
MTADKAAGVVVLCNTMCNIFSMQANTNIHVPITQLVDITGGGGKGIGGT